MSTIKELAESRKRVASLTGLLSRLAAECGIEHGGAGLEANVATYCDRRRQARAAQALQEIDAMEPK